MSQFLPGMWQRVRAVQFFTTSASIHLNKIEREATERPSAEVASSSTARQQPRAPFDSNEDFPRLLKKPLNSQVVLIPVLI